MKLGDKLYHPIYGMMTVKQENDKLVAVPDNDDGADRIEVTHSSIDSILSALLSSEEDIIYIPSGRYDFKGQTITLPKHKTIIGSGSDNTIIRNLCIEMPHGVTVKNIHFIGAAEVQLKSTGGGMFTGSPVFFSNSIAANSVISYSNCIFEDVQYASYARGNIDDGAITSDSAIGCTFNRIKSIAISHVCNTKKSEYINNTFRTIGNNEILTGRVGALFIGDIQNISYVKSYDITITGNTFTDLYTAEDTSGDNHKVNANFIAIYCDKSYIADNYIANHHGFGNDREGIYTKCANGIIKNNILENAGWGEGYIACKGKSHAEDYTVVENNTFIGEYGSGIHIYNGGMIKNNVFKIRKCCQAIVQNGVSEQTKLLTISHNFISCESADYYDSNGELINYKNDRLLEIVSNGSPIQIDNNTIISENVEGNYRYALDMSYIGNNVSITNNTIRIGGSALPLYIHANSTCADKNKEISVNVSDNLCDSEGQGIWMQFQIAEGVETSRNISVKRNITSNKRLYISCGGNGNNDTLEYIVNSASPVSCYTDAANVSGDTNYITK